MSKTFQRKENKIILQPVVIGRWVEYENDSRPVMAAEAWGGGPKKPRNIKRNNEIPEVDISLKNLSNLYDWIEVRESQKISSLKDARNIKSNDVDAFIARSATTDEIGPLLEELTKDGIIIIPEWDNWGFSWYGRFLKGWATNIGFPTFVPVGNKDIDTLLRALRVIHNLKDLKILYIGDIPSHSVNSDTASISLYETFGVEIEQVSMNEYSKKVKGVNKEKALKLVDIWNNNFNVMDNCDKKMEKYTSIYIALKELLNEYNANSFTVDCAYLPDVELVPCVTASLLIDEGYSFGCEGDINQLIALEMLMSASGYSGLMGNLFENAIHDDVINNEIVINHDVIPPSMACSGRVMNFRDFHAIKKGATLYADMPQEEVTIGGISFDSKSIWLSKGKVKWTEDTVHCRLSIGIKVKDAVNIMKNALGHHQVLTYGNCYDAVKLAAEFLGLNIIEL